MRTGLLIFFLAEAGFFPIGTAIHRKCHRSRLYFWVGLFLIKNVTLIQILNKP